MASSDGTYIEETVSALVETQSRMQQLIERAEQLISESRDFIDHSDDVISSMEAGDDVEIHPFDLSGMLRSMRTPYFSQDVFIVDMMSDLDESEESSIDTIPLNHTFTTSRGWLGSPPPPLRRHDSDTDTVVESWEDPFLSPYNFFYDETKTNDQDEDSSYIVNI